MANQRKNNRPAQKSGSNSAWILAGLVLLGGVGYAIYASKTNSPPTAAIANPSSSVSAAKTGSPVASVATNAVPPTIEINQAVMVTVELDFGTKVPSIAEGLQQVDRRYEPADG